MNKPKSTCYLKYQTTSIKNNPIILYIVYTSIKSMFEHASQYMQKDNLWLEIGMTKQRVWPSDVPIGMAAEDFSKNYQK